MNDVFRTGGCLCGAVRYRASGRPLRVGLCHCLDCRKVTGGLFAPFAVWQAERVEMNGKLKTFANRGFCPTCGSHVAWLRDNEAEIMLGSLDAAPSDLAPEYELWTPRREEWMPALPWADQFDKDRS